MEVGAVSGDRLAVIASGKRDAVVGGHPSIMEVEVDDKNSI
jgi:hypothetical protein